ncbi:DUF5924 family protein [Pseudomonas sp. No.21]|jgi:hypothetical protein|uniref:DUF5924 family protein n=1 Tax=Pseudomonas TaxID=286 RepID=UPI000DA88CEE|nr:MULTISPECIES: DUF5924 family protein [Pseudomonas]MDW3714815.1 DUF5924 family protein [Pseudomonas sp. 2023EL-01195]PZE15467.1 DUF2914 domain-containing protein [Pseudomonas sp. 57B-090624]GJN46658.1 hypothetical protein TUM20249_26440 [Pseudomonas tohonis]
MSIWKNRLLALIALIQRHPRLIALYGFCSGVGSFLLVDRGARLAKVIAIIMLVSWVWLLLENLFRSSIERLFKIELPPPLTRFLTQLIHQESLFFVLPFFLITTSWNSGQALFTGMLAVAAVISITDPLYNRFLAPHRWLFLAYHTLTLFAVLLTALPIILHLTTAQSFEWSLGIAVLLSFLSLYSTIRVQRWWRGLALVGLTLALGATGWLTRVMVPPATLWLTEVAVTPELDDHQRTPGKGVHTVTAADLRSDGLYAYTAINAPRGLNERIYHLWRFEGKEVDRIALDIHGGREKGYRAWTHKQNFPANPVGSWQVRVVTEAGQMIGTLRFEVTDDPLPPKPH